MSLLFKTVKYCAIIDHADNGMERVFLYDNASKKEIPIYVRPEDLNTFIAIIFGEYMKREPKPEKVIALRPEFPLPSLEAAEYELENAQAEYSKTLISDWRFPINQNAYHAARDRRDAAMNMLLRVRRKS